MISPSVTDGLSAGDWFVTCDLRVEQLLRGSGHHSRRWVRSCQFHSQALPFLPSDLVFPAGFLFFSSSSFEDVSQRLLPEVVGAIAHLFLTERQYRHTHTHEKRADWPVDARVVIHFLDFSSFLNRKKSRRKRGRGYSDRTRLVHHIQHLYVHWLYPVILSIQSSPITPGIKWFLRRQRLPAALYNSTLNFNFLSCL
jgi:hypothetical protein